MSARQRAAPTRPSRTTPRRRRRNQRQNKTRTCPNPHHRRPTGSTSPARPIPGRRCGSGQGFLTPYWNEKREFEGFWLATVKRIENGEFILEWFDAPEYPPFKSAAKNVALVHPEFRVTGK